TITYAGMLDASAAVSAGLRERGVGAGDVVALLAYNSIDFLTTIFAANHLGAVAMPINWRLAAPEVRYILEHSQARALVCDGDLVALADDAVAGSSELGGLVRVVVGDGGTAGWEPFADLAATTARHPRA